MRFRNPTPVTLGLTGTFAGRSYRVVGRVVLGMEEGGETYYWNEFHLRDTDGKSATLVYEETEHGGAWRLFTLFEPQNPMSVAEAASHRVGQQVNLDGRPLRVMLVDESRVYHIEGEAPEGVEVGDVARYFNAGAGDGMIVVSWTGDEIEFYRGLDLPRGAVAKAFGLPSEAAYFPTQSTTVAGGSGAAKWVGNLVGIFLMVTVFFSFYSCRSSRAPSPVSKPKTPASPLSIDSVGSLRGTTYRVQGHMVVEIAQVGRLYDRHEYELLGRDESRALLVYGSRLGAKDWLLLSPFEPSTSLTPFQAAAKRTGELVELDGTSDRVTDLFLSTIRQIDRPERADSTNGAVFYGFSARSGTNLFLVRWNAENLTCYRGQLLPLNEVLGAFRPNTNR